MKRRTLEGEGGAEVAGLVGEQRRPGRRAAGRRRQPASWRATVRRTADRTSRAASAATASTAAAPRSQSATGAHPSGHRWARPSRTVKAPRSRVWTTPRSWRPWKGCCGPGWPAGPGRRSRWRRGRGGQVGRRPGATGPPWPSSRRQRAGPAVSRSTAAAGPGSGLDQLGEGHGQAVSSPSMPGGAVAHSTSLSSRAWGAWSVAMASMVPSASPWRTASTSAFSRSGGLTLNTGS